MARIKGSQLVSLVRSLQAIRKHVEPQMPPHLLPYLDDRPIATDWYPEEHWRDLVLLLGKSIANRVEGNVWRYIGREGAIEQIGGVYQNRVRKGDTLWTIKQLPIGWQLVRDNGQLSIISLAENEAIVAVWTYAVMCKEVAEINAGYLDQMLKLSGATQTSVEVLEVNTVSARWRLRWS